MTSDRAPTTAIEESSFPPRLAELGWDAGLARELARAVVRRAAADVPERAHADEWCAARVIAQHRGQYVVAADHDDVRAALAGRLRRDAEVNGQPPIVGDWVVCSSPGAGGLTVITQVLPRRSVLHRKRPGSPNEAQPIAANADVALIAASLEAPLNAHRLERYVALVWDSGAVPVILLTKLDCCRDPAGAIALATSLAPGVEVLAVSAATSTSMEDLRARLVPRKTFVIIGPSGVGKSTLVNALLGEERARTMAVRADGKGRHTTTHRELFRLPGGALLIDTPGMREVGLWDASAGLEATFDDIESLAGACRFSDCRHAGEPGCAVTEAIQAGSLDPARLESWHHLRRELEHLARKQDPRADAEARAKVKPMQRALREQLKRKGR